MEVSFSTTVNNKADVIVVGIYYNQSLSTQAEALDNQSQGALSQALKASEFKGAKGEILLIPTLSNVNDSQVLVIGLGNKEDIDEKQLCTLGGQIAVQLSKTPAVTADIRFDSLEANNLKPSEVAPIIATGILLRSWRFNKYRTTLKDEDKLKLKHLSFVVKDATQASKIFKDQERVVEGVFLTRTLASEPSNILYPETFAKQAEELSKLGLKVEVLDEKKMKALGMGALLGVGQGSIRESQLVVMQWQGGHKSDQPLAFVGKGVTFDSGGISIKPAANMDEMKYDMAGAAVVTGLMKALASRKAPINAVGVLGLVENMPSGSSQRPGDIVTTMSGQTVEVLNTDAEGRLVLADALWYTQDRFKPKLMIDLATLTGAIVIALGHEYAGLFSNNDELAARLKAAGEATEEKLWRLPLHTSYDKDINSDVADVKNIGGGRGAGSSIGAQFLQRFVNNTPWAHLDIAGVAWTNKETPLSEKGPTAFGVRLLERFIRDYYEEKP